MFCLSSPCNLPIVNGTEIGSWSLISSCNNPSSQVLNSVNIWCILFICDEILKMLRAMLLFVVIIIAYDYHIMMAPYKSPTAYFRLFAIVLVALDSESKSSG